MNNIGKLADCFTGCLNCCKFTKTEPLFKALVYSKKYAYISCMNRLRYFIEWQAFGVCAVIGERMGIATSTIRKYFIYISFLTMGSPLVIYFFIAFWMNIKRYILNARRNPLRYL
jgi:phage shock protein PspC (stress-responsive transcriptional regulator)